MQITFDENPQRGNRILRELAPETLERLRPHLRQEELAQHETIYHANRPTGRVWFVDNGLISLVHTMRDGRTVELGAFGIADAIGAPAVFGFNDVWFETMVQVSGRARSIALGPLAREVAGTPRLAALLRSSIHLQVEQIAQTSACNRLHNLDQRCARWILIADENVQGEEFLLTHEFLATMLGSHRPAVTLAINHLQKCGYVRCSRSRVTITDREGLKQASCECYSAIHELTERTFSQFEKGFGPHKSFHDQSE